MKQAAKWAFIIVGVFSIGFWAGRSPLTHPPTLSRAERDAGRRAERRPDIFGTTQFLQMELDKAKEVNARERSAVSQQRVEDLRGKLEMAQEAMKLDATRQFSER